MTRETKSVNIKIPAFFPDATHAKIKCLSTKDLISTKSAGVVVNTYHMIVDNLVEGISKSGGLSKFMGIELPIITDSGGFQVMSLIRRNNENGEISDEGARFKVDGKEILLTPEICIQTQYKLKPTIMMCLDDCTDPSENDENQEKSVDRTLLWAQRCKEELERLCGSDTSYKPLLFSIIQGGNNKKLRKKCAGKLKDIGFDGYAFGGWPIDETGKFMKDILRYCANRMPDNTYKYAMGVGKPEDIMSCIEMGYNLFDCVLPTRDARHKRLYIFKYVSRKSYEFLYMRAAKNLTDYAKISDFCDCELCTKHTRSELYGMYKENYSEACRLATIHNLRFYSMLMNGF